MNLTLPIPDDLGERLSAGGADLARRALEAFALEEYNSGRLSLPELGRLLGFETRACLDRFLKARGVYGSLHAGRCRAGHTRSAPAGAVIHGRVFVSDTGPVHYLVLIDEIEILPRLFTTVLVPPSVRAELDRPETPTLVRTWVAEHPAWLEVRPTPVTDDPRLRSVHEGERDAIALAVAIGADLLLMDATGPV